MTSINSSPRLRLRIFAGPNGSGKSTVIGFIRKQKVKDRYIDFGYYVNADDLAASLRSSKVDFNEFDIKTNNREFLSIALASGLINRDFSKKKFEKSYSLRSNSIKLKTSNAVERVAQIIADFLRKKLLKEKRRFSFETVFSHSSKIDIIKDAVNNGYKVYLYFVSTESPEINRFRVAARKAKGGHDVPPDKIVSRYYRSMENLFPACQFVYQAFFFDNSVDGKESKMFAHFKKTEGNRKKWDKINKKDVPDWFKKYYSARVRIHRRSFQ